MFGVTNAIKTANLICLSPFQEVLNQNYLGKMQTKDLTHQLQLDHENHKHISNLL